MSMNKFNQLYAPPCYITETGDLAASAYENNDREIVEWHKEEITKSKNFLRSQLGWKSADSCMSILRGEEVVYSVGKLSTLTIKKLRRQTREAVANASNIRPRWQTKAKPDYQETAAIYNKRRDAWFYNLFIDRFIKEALQYGAGAGTGYLMLWPEINPRTGRYDIMPKVLSHKNVFPFHASIDSRPENVWGISCWFEMALPDAHEQWPEYMDIIKSDRDVPSYMAGREVNKIQPRWGRSLVDWISGAKTKNPDFSPYPVADIFFTWIRDNTINESGHELTLGEPGSNYSYSVPSKFDQAKQRNKVLNREVIGSDHPEYENPSARFITEKECRLFPNRRFMITTNYGVIYDGPPIWICNRPPVEWFKFEEIVGEWLGVSLIRDGRNLERSANNMLRAIEDSVVGRIQPPIAINENLPKDVINQLKSNVRHMIGKVFKSNLMVMEKVISPLLDAKYFDIDARAVELIKFIHEMSDYLMGTSDFSAWQRLKQLPAADTQESMIQNLGILATDHERTIERSILSIADIWQQFAPQVYTQDELITTLGKDGITEETWDFNASSLLAKKDPNDRRSLNQRLVDHINIFYVHASPHSIQERMSVTNKLTIAQIKKMGAPISDRKLYETFVDDGGYAQSLKEFNAEQEAKILLAARLQMKLQEVAQANDPNNQLVDKVIETIRGQSSNEGRPSSNTAPPRLEQKMDQDGIPRSTMATN